MSKVYYQRDGLGMAQANMDLDLALLDQIREQGASVALRVYEWVRDAVSIGRRQQAEDFEPGWLDQQNWVRRPTGGGAVIHDADELTYALCVARDVLPDGLKLNEVPGLYHKWFIEALPDGPSKDTLLWVAENSPGPYNFCFSAPVIGDVSFNGNKVAGSALRAWRDAVLIQGSLQGIPFDKEVMEETLRSAAKKFVE